MWLFLHIFAYALTFGRSRQSAAFELCLASWLLSPSSGIDYGFFIDSNHYAIRRCPVKVYYLPEVHSNVIHGMLVVKIDSSDFSTTPLPRHPTVSIDTEDAICLNDCAYRLERVLLNRSRSLYPVLLNMGPCASVTNVGFPRIPLFKNSSIAIGICCLVFTIVFYSSTHLTSLGSFMTECSPAAESTGQYQQYLLWKLQAPSEKDSIQASQVAHHASQMDEQKNVKPAKGALPVPKIPSKATQVAHDATIKLQYAMNSSKISRIEGPDLFSMAKHISTFARLLEAIIADDSIDRRPFLDLRERYFGWWKPTTTTHLPWEAQNHTTGIVLTAGQGNMRLAAHAIRTLRNVVNTTLPIQVAYAGDDDLPAPMRKDMRALDPKLGLINILDHYDEDVAGLRFGGYAMKPFAALACSFEKVIIIDADTIFMQRPDEWFEEDAGLKQTGTLFFHDRAYGGRRTTDWVKDLLKESGQKPSATLNSSMYWQQELEHQQESGVVYFNKAIPTAFMSLLFTTYMNTQNVRAHLYGQVAGT